jgi:lipoprotein-anchoring transpeptidase ErfK/SrfK
MLVAALVGVPELRVARAGGSGGCVDAAAPTDAEATRARLVVTTEARADPGESTGVALVKATTSWGGAPTWLLVRRCAIVGESRTTWLEVVLPDRSRARSGWIPLDRVELARTAFRVEISTATRMVRVLYAGHPVRRFPAVVGTAGTPTPHGRFAIVESVAQPRPWGFFGPWVIRLTAHSGMLRAFDGGPGTVGIHGRGGTSLADPLGTARSHGCIRIRNADVVWLATHVPPGSPVTIT